MKRLKKINVLGHTYKIISNNGKECKTALDAGTTNELLGCVLLENQKIYIKPTQSIDAWNATLWHEIFHCIFQHLGYHKLKNNEKLVDNIGTMVYSILKENKLWKQ